ncbi:hypothetical protein SCHPADRAFT_901629 [Schizopora paradoxa]|uniref:Uncharacterized protein n=1 Tax=Schizopora paradoxa TaxID=27342 RepID=A0A0H2RXA4_9AGAM|nr:hypothetical protein SCHPADRAFT_901629 [Schizopora paradoxa]
MAQEIWLKGIDKDQVKPNCDYPLLANDGSLRLRYAFVVVYSPSAFHRRHSGNGSEWEETKNLVRKDLGYMKVGIPRLDNICRMDDYSFVCFWDFLDNEPEGLTIRTLSSQTIARARSFSKIMSSRLRVVMDEEVPGDVGIREFLEFDWCVTTSTKPSSSYLSNSRYFDRIRIKDHDAQRLPSFSKQRVPESLPNRHHFPHSVPVPSPPTGPRATRRDLYSNVTITPSSSSSVSKPSLYHAPPAISGLPVKPGTSTNVPTTTARSVTSLSREEIGFSTSGATKRSDLVSPTTSANDPLQQTKPRGVFEPSRNVFKEKEKDRLSTLTRIESVPSSSSNHEYSTPSTPSWAKSAPASAANIPTPTASSSSRVPFPFKHCVPSVNDSGASTIFASPVAPAKRSRDPSEGDDEDGTGSSASVALKKAAKRMKPTSSALAHNGKPSATKLERKFERQLSTLNDVLEFYTSASIAGDPDRKSTPAPVTISSLAEKIFELVRDKGAPRYPHALGTTSSSRSGTDSPVTISSMDIDGNTFGSHDIRELEELRAKLEAAQAENGRLESLRVSEVNRAESLQQTINDAGVRAKGAERRAKEEELKVKELTRALEAERTDNAKAAAENKKCLEDMQQVWEGRVKEHEALLGEVQMERDGLVNVIADLRRGLRESEEKLAREEEALKSTRTELGRVSKKLVDAQVREGTLSNELERCKQSLANTASREVEERRSARVEEEERGRQLMKLFHVSLTANTKGTRDTEGVLRAERSRRLAAETAMLEIAQALGFECQ